MRLKRVIAARSAPRRSERWRVQAAQTIRRESDVGAKLI
jgi:hypothetical protein